MPEEYPVRAFELKASDQTLDEVEVSLLAGRLGSHCPYPCCCSDREQFHDDSKLGGVPI
jgi:hypothetical protein